MKEHIFFVIIFFSFLSSYSAEEEKDHLRANVLRFDQVNPPIEAFCSYRGTDPCTAQVVLRKLLHPDIHSEFHSMRIKGRSKKKGEPVDKFDYNFSNGEWAKKSFEMVKQKYDKLAAAQKKPLTIMQQDHFKEILTALEGSLETLTHSVARLCLIDVIEMQAEVECA
jgi:hypothetical protein